jgi:hypothetical protein
MGKKGKWLTSVKNAFRSPIKDGDDEELEAKDLDLFGDIRPLGVSKARHLLKSERVVAMVLRLDYLTSQ